MITITLTDQQALQLKEILRTTEDVGGCDGMSERSEELEALYVTVAAAIDASLAPAKETS